MPFLSVLCSIILTMPTKKEPTTKKTSASKAEPKVKKVSKVAEKGADFVVIATGGKQYQVYAGDSLKVEKISDSIKIGDKVSFDKVLLTDDGSNTVVGSPFIAGAKVSAEILEIGRADKVVVIKYKQKSRYFKKRGHRQPYTKVKIISVK